ncbi:unnamed protein product [Meganyctiphanes norvegica]|uniref:Uncharacterized protein n=1 Tax=Meganyctiphanes norvegica TaxID=48144 RepID=A0AAV2S1H2_MEGNR
MQSSLRKEQYGAVQFLARLGRTPSEAHKLLTTAYQEDALRKAATRTCHKRFKMLGKEVYDSPMRRKLRTKCRRLSRPMSPDNKSKVCITDIKNLEELKNDTPGGINNMEEFESNISGDSRICDEDLEYKSLVCNKECTEDNNTDVLVENLRDDQRLCEEDNIQCTQNFTFNDKSNYISNVVNLEKDDNDDNICTTDINNLEEFGKSISGYISNIEKSGKDTLKNNTNFEDFEKYILGVRRKWKIK